MANLSNCCTAPPVGETSGDLGFCSDCREGAAFYADPCHDCSEEGTICVTHKGFPDIMVCDTCFCKYYVERNNKKRYR